MVVAGLCLKFEEQCLRHLPSQKPDAASRLHTLSSSSFWHLDGQNHHQWQCHNHDQLQCFDLHDFKLSCTLTLGRPASQVEAWLQELVMHREEEVDEEEDDKEDDEEGVNIHIDMFPFWLLSRLVTGHYRWQKPTFWKDGLLQIVSINKSSYHSGQTLGNSSTHHWLLDMVSFGKPTYFKYFKSIYNYFACTVAADGRFYKWLHASATLPAAEKRQVLPLR